MAELFARREPGLRLAGGWERVEHLVPAAAPVLVTALDSHRAPGTVALLRDRVPEATQHGDALLTTAEAFGRLVQDRGLFAGFDEAWVFSGAPPSADAKPPSITSEDPVAATAAIAVWVESTGVLVGFGDGDGLNVVTPSTAIAATLGIGAVSDAVVSMTLWSDSLTPAQVAERVGLTEGEAHTNRTTGNSVWSYGGDWSDVPARRQLADIVALVARHADRLAALPPDCHAKVTLGISTTDDVPPVNVYLDRDELATLARANVALAISFYP